MRVLITGATGFIGSNLIKFINKNKNIIEKNIHDNIEIMVERFSVENKREVKENLKTSDIVIHLAAKTCTPESFARPEDFFKINYIGTYNILETCRKFEIKKIIYISTIEVYGSSLNGIFTEEDVLKPQSPYAASKAAAEMLVHSYFSTYNLPTVILRLGNQYGPMQRTEKIVPRFITNVLLKKPMIIHGKGEQTREWTYIEDTVDVIAKTLYLKNIDGKTFNITSEEEASIKRIADMIKENMSGYKPKIEFDKERQAEIKRIICSTEMAQKMFGWHSKIKLSDGLKMTIKWYKENESFWKQ